MQSPQAINFLADRAITFQLKGFTTERAVEKAARTSLPSANDAIAVSSGAFLPADFLKRALTKVLASWVSTGVDLDPIPFDRNSRRDCSGKRLWAGQKKPLREKAQGGVYR